MVDSDPTPGTDTRTTSPGLMSGVTASQQTPPGWLISRLGSPAPSVPSARLVTTPFRVTTTVAVLPTSVSLFV